MNSGFRKLLIPFLALLIATSALAADAPSTPEAVSKTAAVTVEPRPPADVPDSPSAHRFWDRKNLWLFSGIAAMRAVDYTSTLNMQARGREEILLPDDVVNNRQGFAALEAAGVATSIGLSYLLHSTGHHKLERWVSITHISVAGFGAARNYALESKHP